MCFVKRVPSSQPESVVWVLHSVESAGCSSLDVRDLVVKHLHAKQKPSVTTACRGWSFRRSMKSMEIIFLYYIQLNNTYFESLWIYLTLTLKEVSKTFPPLTVSVSPRYICLYELHVSTYGTELLAFISHLFPYRPTLRSEEIPEVDGVDSSTGLLVQSGLLADPVENLPVQGTVVIQEGLQLHKEECSNDERSTDFHTQIVQS